MRVLVTGGAGYIGAHVIRALRLRGDEVVAVDDLSGGREDRLGDTPLERVDLASDAAADSLAGIMERRGIDSVIHLAALKQVGESVEQPARYYRQNVGGVAAVVDASQRSGVGRLVFSSTAAVYAESDAPVTERAPTRPANPYGETKLAGEWLVEAGARAGGFAAASLRYFNVAGAAAPELVDAAAHNLIPIVLRSLDAGEAPAVFGDDYSTPDGTCVRDYVHVSDVADAHVAVLDALGEAAPGSRVYNVGTGTGASVLDVLASVARVTGREVVPRVTPRRAGDPSAVVADVSRIREELGWTSSHDLDETVRSAWEAHRAAPR